jgi:hypothetical protein
VNGSGHRSSFGGHARRSVVGYDNSLDAFYKLESRWERVGRGCI